jgi:HD-GYP domain-containing protein (c-di-GMP phosphodiesterase class II)
MNAQAQILVVEPETALQAALSAWLEWEGYDCACASDPEEALAIAEHERTDVALVSDGAAAWTGSGLAQALKARREDLAVILMCGGTRRNKGSRRHAEGIDEIPAPITRGAVTQAVTRAVRWREAPRADRQACLIFERAMLKHAQALRQACLAAPDDADAVLPHSLGNLMEWRSPGARLHAQRVTRLAQALGEALKLPARTMKTLDRAAYLHDLGKAALPEELLHKPTPLSDLEIALIRRHPQIAYDILADVPELDEVAPIVLATQERFDGTGYPHGLAALEIPLCARIIAVVDAFDLLTHGHPLGAPLSLAEACAELVRAAGGQFDPDLVQVWLRLADAETRPAAR